MTRHTHTLVLILLALAVVQIWPTQAAAQTPLLEVESGPNKLMRVNADGGMVVFGHPTGAIPASGSGHRLMWYPAKAAFRAGSAGGASWDDANVGTSSVALGFVTTASGEISTALGSATSASGNIATAMGAGSLARGNASTAMGRESNADGEASTAMGFETQASGGHSTAMGERTAARGLASTAMGDNTKAIGERSTAMGSETTANGLRSTAMGFRTTAGGNQSMVLGSNAQTFPAGVGSFVYGDAAGTTAISSIFPNEFLIRASGGFQFRTSPNLSTGCNLPAGSGTFACTSSRLAKEGFEDLDGETVLGKLASIPIQRWRYRGTQTPHVGPTAEDFHAAFQLGQGPTTISTVDADGISLLAVQALERRTSQLREENAVLRAKLAEDSAALRTELEALRQIIQTVRVAP